MTDKVKTRFLFIPPTGTPGLGEVDLLPAPLYDESLQGIVKPLLSYGDSKARIIERVRVLADFKGGTDYSITDLFVDEDGIEKGLPRNEYATRIYRRATLLGRTAEPVPDDPEKLPAIYGPAVLFEREVWF